MDVEKIARAIEADAGEHLPGLRQALKEAEALRAAKTLKEVEARGGRVTTPDQLRAHQAVGERASSRRTKAKH